LVDRGDRGAVATFFAAEPLAAGRVAALGEDEAHHAHVRRVGVGEQVRLVDGAGAVATGTVVKLARSFGAVAVERVEQVEPAGPIHLLAPIGDRDRMLWLAEKATELGIASWRPVLWRRSRSVSPRGEGMTFASKVRARMVGALTQSGGAWLPSVFPDATLEHAVAAVPPGYRILLDSEGEPILSLAVAAPVTVALGPEGGFDQREREALLAAGFVAASLGLATLRFETAGVAAIAIIRVVLASRTERARG
jgi:16S rRNA (uracil1498-N3)-methyltransferase